MKVYLAAQQLTGEVHVGGERGNGSIPGELPMRRGRLRTRRTIRCFFELPLLTSSEGDRNGSCEVIVKAPPVGFSCAGARGRGSSCGVRGFAACAMRWFRNSIHHDLDAVAGLDLGMCLEPVEDAKALRRAVDAGHAVR